jgi:tetratricopeptide (TPR) repeat protein
MSAIAEVKELYERGERLRIEGKHQTALQLLKQANEQAKGLGKTDVLRADISHTLGFILFQINDYAEAEIHFKAAAATKKLALQHNDNSTATSKR